MTVGIQDFLLPDDPLAKQEAHDTANSKHSSYHNVFFLKALSYSRRGTRTMTLYIIRAVFLVAIVCAAAAMSFDYADIHYGSDQTPTDAPSGSIIPWVIMLVVVVLAGLTIAIDLWLPNKKISTISAIFFGLIVGLILTYLFQITGTAVFTEIGIHPSMQRWIYVIASVLLSYICITVLLQTQGQFRFVIPYVEFSKEIKGFKPLVLDTSVIIDGRIADICNTHILDSPLVIPDFVLNELQGIADSNDKLKRNRGRRGLEILKTLQKSPDTEYQVHDEQLPELAVQSVEQQVVLLAKHLRGKVVTNDYNLNQMAQVQGVNVININELSNAVKPVVLHCESLQVKLIKEGEESGQGVGYLDDGTMVVVEDGRSEVGQDILLTVTSVLQTSAGRMIFGKFERLLTVASR